MVMTNGTAKVERQLDGVLAELMRAADGSRSTLRYDDPARGWSVQIPCAEALTPVAKSLKGDGSINQRAAATVKWLEKHRAILVQPDLSNCEPAAPPALIALYGVQAQMLGPLLRADGYLQGWISVHYIGGPHPIGEKAVDAMQRALGEVSRIVGLTSTRIPKFV